jgi:hypothetical protein
MTNAMQTNAILLLEEETDIAGPCFLSWLFYPTNWNIDILVEVPTLI